MSFSVNVGLPDEDSWIPLLLPDEPVEDWVEMACAAWEVPEHLLETYRTALAWHAEQFRRQDSYRGALYVPDIEAGIVATWSLDLGNWDEQGEVDLDQVEKAARERERPDGFQDATVERVTLPCGPAVRVRGFDVADDGSADATLAESVTHAILPTDVSDDHGRQVFVLTRLTWVEVVHGDELAELADGVAERLDVRMDA